MALFAALCAVVRVDIARAEPASCACETDRFAIVPFRVVQHFLVEHVSLQHVVASVAAPSFSPPLALDAVFRVRFEAFCVFPHRTWCRCGTLYNAMSNSGISSQNDATDCRQTFPARVVRRILSMASSCCTASIPKRKEEKIFHPSAPDT